MAIGLVEAYQKAESLGVIRGQQTAGSYMAVINRKIYHKDKIESNPPQVGDDAVVMLENAEKKGQKIFIIGKIIAVEADSDVRVGVYVSGSQAVYAPATVTARFVPQLTFAVDEEGNVEVLMLRTVLNVGTTIKRLTGEFIDAFMNMFGSRRVFTPGRFLGSSVPFPMWLPHFGTYDDNGIGEAYHMGIFGRTGSGKSALAKILMAYYASHPTMSVIVLDPQGEFLRDFQKDRKGTGTYPLNVEDYWTRSGGSVIYAPISRIAFSDKRDIRTLLGAVIHRIGKYVGISREKGEELVEAVLPIFHGIALYLAEKDKYVPADVVAGFDPIGSGGIGDLIRDALKRRSDENITDTVLSDIARMILNRIEDKISTIYASESSREAKKQNIEDLKNDPKLFEEFKEEILGIIHLLEGDETLEDLIVKATSSHTLLVLSISDVDDDEFLQYFLIDAFLKRLVSVAQARFKKGEHLNTMVFLDEAHRFVPSNKQNDTFAESLRMRLIRAVRETRKYGLGWTFISQTLGSLDKDIVYQIRIFFIGYGLVMASERDKVRELVSGYPGAMDVYMSFPDPFSAKFFGKSMFPFMVVGPASPLSATGAPLFFSSYDAQKASQALNKVIKSL